MRIVYLNPCGQLGGAETSLRELLASIQTAAPDWELCVVLGEDGPFAAEARSLGVQVVVEAFPAALARLGDSQQSFLRLMANLLAAAVAALQYRRRLDAILRSLRPRIIHTNGFKMHLLGASIRRRGSTLIWHIHDYVSTRRMMSRLLRLFQNSCQVAITNSNSVANDVRTLMPGLQIVPVYNAIDLDRFSPSGPRIDLDALAGLGPVDPGTIRIGLVSTFARWKGHKVFLEAIARLADAPAVRGYVIGGPIYQTDHSQWSRQELEAEAGRLGLSGKVGFTGFLSDTSAAMRSLDIVVHASTQPEPFGMVIVEAMGCGTAVIASQAGGASELFVEGETALGHPPGDAEALAEKMRCLATDAALRRRLGAAGRASAEKLYNGKRLARELLAIYAQAVGPKAGVAGKTEMESCTVGK